jgi:cbb3-type cytochrome oxidase cytochrome c subunit
MKKIIDNNFILVRTTALVFFLSFFSACIYEGDVLFEKAGCINCHSFKGKGGMVSDLTAVTQRRSERWIQQKIRNPKKNHPNSRMPEFEHLSEFEIRAIIRYLKS